MMVVAVGRFASVLTAFMGLGLGACFGWQTPPALGCAQSWSRSLVESPSACTSSSTWGWQKKGVGGADLVLRDRRRRRPRPSININSNNNSNTALYSSSVGLAEAIEVEVKKRFPVGSERVIAAWERLLSGEEFRLDHGGKYGIQQAGSYVPGLTAKPWYESSEFEWALGLEERAGEIIAEFEAVAMAQDSDLESRGTNVWAPPVVEEALDYGPDWKTLVLQDRRWDPVNASLFPVTTRIVRDELNVPSQEVFFARQDPRSGIKPHTDNTNFIMTAHLGLRVPEGKCWIKVGHEKREWRKGKTLVFDTSFYHSTANDADTDRVVLLIRFWHPELSKVEREALTMIFAAIEDPSILSDREWDPEAWMAGQTRFAGGGADEALGSFREEILSETRAGGGGGGDASLPSPSWDSSPSSQMTRQARRKAEREAKKAAGKKSR